MYTVFGFYKFKKIKFLKKYKSLFQKEILKNNVRGTIILSAEGINGTIAGKRNDISKIIKIIKRQYRLKDFDSKNISESLFQPFHKGKIKIKNEVVPLGLKINPKNKKLNRYVSGKSWNKLISNKETLVIDADKENYLNYYETCIELINKKGLIVIDNVLWHGEVIDDKKNDKFTNIIREFNTHIKKDSRVAKNIIPIGDGLTICIKK